MTRNFKQYLNNSEEFISRGVTVQYRLKSILTHQTKALSAFWYVRPLRLEGLQPDWSLVGRSEIHASIEGERGLVSVECPG